MATEYSSWLDLGGYSVRVVAILSWSGGTLSWSGRIESSSGSWASGSDPWQVSGAFSASGTKSWQTPTGGSTLIASGSKAVAQKSTSQSLSITFRVSNIQNTSSSRSASVSVTVPALADPVPTETPTITTWRDGGSDYRIAVGWSSVPTGATKIRIQRWDPSSDWEVVGSAASGPTTGWTDRTTRPNRHYRYRAQWGNASGWGPFSASYAAQWEDTTPPKPPPPSVSKTSAGDVKVSFLAPSSMETPPAASWGVQRSSDGGSTWTTAATGLSLTGSLSWTHSSPDPASSWTYRTRIETQYGDAPSSAWSGPSKTLTTAVPMLAPDRLAPQVADATEPITITYRPNPGSDGAPQTEVEYAWRPWSEGVEPTASWTLSGRIATDTPAVTIPAGTWQNRYHDGTNWVDGVEVRVRTWGVAAAASPFSESLLLALNARPVVGITSPAASVPGPVLTVAWTYSDDDYGTTTSSAWRARLLSGGGQELEVRSGTTQTAATFQTVLADQATYTVEVRARDYTMQWSDPDTVTFATDFHTPPAPTLVAAFDADAGYTALTVDAPPARAGEEAVDHLRVERAMPGGWVVVADGLEPGETVTDMVPPLGQAVVYRAVAVAAIGSVAYSPSAPLDTTTDWLFINHGPGFGRIVRFRSNVTGTRSVARDRSRHHFAGRPRPVELAGPAVARSWTISTDLFHECIVGPRPEQATWTQVDDLAVSSAPACLRGPHGLRAWVSVDDASESGLYETASSVGVRLTEVDWDENRVAVEVEP